MHFNVALISRLHPLNRTSLLFICSLLLLPLTATAATTEANEDASVNTSTVTQACLEEALLHASDATTLGAIRESCQSQALTEKNRAEKALTNRRTLEDATEHNPFVITPHRRNYILPITYWSNPVSHEDQDKGREYRNIESKFQLSIKVPIAKLWDDAKLYGAFTATFFWQTYSKRISSPFRETNYEPEIFISQPVDWQFGPVESKLLSYGFDHQSNGRDVPLSRSWNRLYFDYTFNTGPWYWSLKPWWRIPEDKKKKPSSRSGDDNPDIEHYLGHFELTLARPFGDQMIEAKLRNNLHSHHNAGSLELNYTFPLHGRFKGIIQGFTGYGDSLINYNDYQNRIGFGILLTDIL